MIKETGSWHISVYGLNCAECTIYKVSHGNEKAMKAMLEYLKDAKPEAVVCKGCRCPLDKHWSANCYFLACTKNKNAKYCFECVEFPCGKLQSFASDRKSHHKRTVENMRRMKEIGIDAWL